ncbi:hypothetical protein C8N35_1128 [Breoghania corrubedonensis]|uniref:Uncharacterized protein n=1 Tax=Breoghania corrubedonensis TaxID=665038 RepID=A0A2T5UVY1_9HYPH|nr:hypothetical protein [Breoghania corrubedonensis]PTW55685.1 hypothetical protein C8N35_1128 [Breoghania corrubedonensis]
MKRTLATLAILGLSLGTACADTLGTIKATWNGSKRTWFITSFNGQSQSSHTDAARVVDSFNLWGNPQEGDVAATKNVVSLGFSVMTGPKGKQAIDASVYYLDSGLSDMWDASEDGQTKVTLDVFDKTETTVHVTGSFHATPTKAGKFRQIDGIFDVTFPLN